MADDLARILDLLRRLGATDPEIESLSSGRSLGDLALELVVRTAPPVPAAQAAADARLTDEELRYVWTALGLPASRIDSGLIPADLAAALPLLADASREWLGEDMALALTRVVGNAAARLAEALVDAYRVQFEVPQLQSGESYADVVERQVELTQGNIAGFGRFIVAAFHAHLVRVASAAWAPDEAGGATRRELFVGFVDLVGYTALARTMALGELAGLLAAFEQTVAEVVGAGGGRLVKLIGDSAMFVADSPAAGCGIALDIARRLAESDRLPPARVGADCGEVLTLSGDYFGDVVNRAARLVAVANPSTVVVSDAVAAACGEAFDVEQLPARALKGFGVPAVTFRLLAR